MKNFLKKLYIVACICILIVSLIQIGRYFLDYSKGKNAYEQAQTQFGISDLDEIPPDTEQSVTNNDDKTDKTDPKTRALLKKAAKAFKKCDFQSLMNTNNEMIGWIIIPGTRISYPICQGRDNSYYLTHTFDKTYNRVGAIFADYRITQPFTDTNTILYGHHMRDQSMFAGLMAYQNKETWEKNPYVYVCTPETIYVYEIYSAFQGDPMGLSYQIKFSTNTDTKTDAKTDTNKETNPVTDTDAFIEYTKSNAYYDTEITPTPEDKFLTLSTCTGNGHAKRMIVHCRLRGSKQR